ncbi:ABC transporter substrate-binding protein [Verticiella sediminum]|uniref:ABC transporter substrate-binding protein n=1 Tax=Verticiella sediminum TaxID=1247510 RepID=A0A556A6B5_9BURK|nr:TRAP transporter substrate-binding protein [Verticiella sediminum]TSH88430.1 ABC transporter substrate-binding protein [Verticiella sediminum]
MQRRSFLKKASLGAVAGSAAVAAPVFAQDAPTLNWRMPTSFPRSLEALYGVGELMCRYIGEATGGKFNIRPFPGGEIVPALQVLDSVQNGTVECGQTVSYYYYGKDPTLCFDAAVPFGLNARQMNAWMFQGDGMKLTREMFKAYNIVNFPMGNTGVQMGGWFRNEIKSVEDLKGLKMRTAGFAGEVLSRMGVVPQQLAGGDVYPALEKGTLDAVEFVGPYDDEKLGFNKVARNYYYPGWWEGGPQISLYVNEKSWEALPKSYQAVIETASRLALVETLSRYDAWNAPALRRLIANGAQLRAFPREVMDASWDAANAVYKEFSDRDPKFKAMYDNYMSFRDSSVPWFRAAEGAYDQYLSAALSRAR